MSEADHIPVTFEAAARRSYFATLEAFRYETKHIDRDVDESSYRRHCQQFVQTLRQQLQGVAQDLLRSHCDYTRINVVNHQLQNIIEDFLRQFVQQLR